MGDYQVSSNELRERGTKGIMSAGAGLGLWGISALLNIPVVGWVIGGGLVVLGLMGVFGKSRTDKVSGGVMMAAGVAGIATIFLHGLTTFVLGAGGFGLLAYGGWNIFKFVKGLRHRA
jgi:hypothetical protein